MDREHARPEHTGVRRGGRLHDREVLGREGHGTGVDDLAHAGDEVFAGPRHRAADRDDRGVHEADAGRQHLADVTTGLPYSLDRVDVAALDEFDDVVVGIRLDALLAEGAGDGRAGGEGFEASAVAAVAGHVGAARDADVSDVAGDALGAALQEAARDDARADAGRDLHEHEVFDLRPGECSLAEGHDVHVVVDEHGHLEVLLHPAGHVEAIPAGHDRRVDGAPGGVLDRTGHADADGDEILPVATEPFDEGEPRVDEPAEHGLGAQRDVERLAVLGEHRAGEVGDGDRRVRGAEVGGEHDARSGVERELRRRASAGRGGVGDGGDEAEFHEFVDPRGDGGAGEARARGERCACTRRPVTEQLEELARARGAECRAAADVDHALSKAHHLVLSLYLEGVTTLATFAEGLAKGAGSVSACRP